MGQYYVIANLDKKQYLDPHKFRDGAKLLEFGPSCDGTMFGLALLLSNGNGRGRGDLKSDDPIIGSWAGDRIVVAGDYGDQGRWVEEVNRGSQQEYGTLYDYSISEYEDISTKVAAIVHTADA